MALLSRTISYCSFKRSVPEKNAASVGTISTPLNAGSADEAEGQAWIAAHETKQPSSVASRRRCSGRGVMAIGIRFLRGDPG